MKIKLWVKLTAAFVLVAIVGVFTVAILANRTTTTNFRRFLRQDSNGQLSELQATLSRYYARQESWQDVETLLSSLIGSPGGGQGGTAWRLLDSSGQIVASSMRGRGRFQDEEGVDEFPIFANGRQVGTLLLAHQGQGPGGPPEAQQFLDNVNRALAWAGLGAMALALLLAVLLAQGLTRPIHQLTRATRALAHGDLSQQVQVTGNDEVGELAASFNQMAAALAEGEKQRQQLLADVAHELRTPLSVMRGHLEAMLDGVFEATPENLTLVHEETLLLGRLVEELRTLSLAEAGQLPLNLSQVDIADLARQAAAAFDPLAEAEGIRLLVDLPPALPPVSADPARIQQALGNLLSNALRHVGQAAAHPTVRLSAMAVSQAVRVSISDNGPGLTPEAQRHVFDRFWRADAARSREQGGSGLGLAICKGIISAHSGRIWVESTPGQGATFTFELPVASGVMAR